MYLKFRLGGRVCPFEQNVLFGGNKEFVYLNKMQAKKTVGWEGEFLGYISE